MIHKPIRYFAIYKVVKYSCILYPLSFSKYTQKVTSYAAKSNKETKHV